jgi:DNA-binding PadR family transcriptional regulator
MHHVLREIEKRIITHFMDFLILSALGRTNSGSSGYDIIKYIHTHFRLLPSSGTVYATLYAMERKGLLQGIQESRRRVFCLTSKGHEVLQEMERASDNINELVIRLLSVKSAVAHQLS